VVWTSAVWIRIISKDFYEIGNSYDSMGTSFEKHGCKADSTHSYFATDLKIRKTPFGQIADLVCELVNFVTVCIECLLLVSVDDVQR
jgi:hypothetical protein